MTVPLCKSLVALCIKFKTRRTFHAYRRKSIKLYPSRLKQNNIHQILKETEKIMQNLFKRWNQNFASSNHCFVFVGFYWRQIN